MTLQPTILQVENQGPLLHSGFLSSVKRFPGNVALSIKQNEWTYTELNDKACRWASALLEASDTTPKRVGIFAYRSLTSYVGVLASLFSGATFVPFNRNFPIQRTCMMMELADLDAVLVDKGSLPQFCEIIKNLKQVPKCVLLPESSKKDLVHIRAEVRDQTDLECAPPLVKFPFISTNSVAYLLFTSGSTGISKGVPITHKNVTHFMQVNQQRYQITDHDRFTQTFDQTFDLSIFDLFMAWGCGAAVCSMDPIHLLSPFSFIREKGITVWFSVPSVAVLLCKQNFLKQNSMPSLRWSFFCGEVLLKTTAEAWQLAAPNSIIENLYGPTELTIACTAYRWDPIKSPMECVNESVPIGKLYPGMESLILDENLEPVPYGSEGELCISGPQTFLGYWSNSEQTLTSLVEYKDDSGQTKVFYRTGDRVRYLPSGDLTYLGRLDHQVKVQGYRVELSEVEAMLLRQPNVVSAVAVGWPLESGTIKGITAFVVGANLDSNAILRGVRKELPAYMVPHTVHVLDKMPLNSNGKIDRKALMKHLESEEMKGEY
ncbi:amino acid adenylation domain-containing protein [Thermoactinomyces sp. DSM 45891]|uniref:amino acid adenylation domain-containing protein n=1 Tax=Thermoactinomyces sp. DSM 45891 TaxID=1761907 RepID=UPI00091C53BF|nr:amino acid adenylation domain-containing protein [Thermoactinomyces sp. DSM 45891]SFX57317.1 amino acid adenylation domain-containing protein [Thermoactinomyces sp. DSM 45891]